MHAARRNICCGLPLLGDYLEDGLAMFDEGIVDMDPTTAKARRTSDDS